MIDMVLNPTPYTPTVGRGLLRFNAAGQLVIRKSDGSEINVSMAAAYGIVGADIASASTTDLVTATGDYINITGTATINALGTVPAGAIFTLVFLGVGQITHNATSLILPGATNLTRAVGDVGIFRSLGAGNWRCVSFLRTPTVTNLSQNLSISGVISPTLFSSQQNDYNPSGLSTATVLRLTASGAQNITGLQGGSIGRVIILMNIAASSITLKDEDATSTAANRFAFTGDVVLAQDAACMIQYDSTTTRWRLVGGGGADTNTSVSVDNELVLFNGTTGKSLKRSNATGRPKLTSGVLSVAAIDLTTEVANDLPFANLAQGSALSVLGVTGNATADQASIAAASDHQVMRRSGTAVSFGQVNLGQGAAVTGVLTTPNGGTNVSSPGASGNALLSNGTNWVSGALPTKNIARREAGYDTSSATEETVWTVTIPASTLTASNMFLQFAIGGTLNNNANTKRIRVKIGSKTLLDTGTMANTGAEFWTIRGTMMRYTSTAVVGGATIELALASSTIPTRSGTLNGPSGASFGSWDSNVDFILTFQSSASTVSDIAFAWGHITFGPN